MSDRTEREGVPQMVALMQEIAYARDRFGPFTSSHEGLGVLLEEFDELKDAIRSNDTDATRREAIQVAAVALRLADSMDVEQTRERSVP